MKAILISQYKASLKMLLDIIARCPESLWYDDTYENAYWRIVYHALFYTALYLADNPRIFQSWPKHRANYQCLGATAFDGQPVSITDTYTKAEMSDYAEGLAGRLEEAVSEAAFAGDSGFEWLRMSNLEKHLYAIRHLQHHTGQLTERLHQCGIKGIKWEG